MGDESAHQTITRNKKAYHNYFVDDEYEAGVRLVGTEVESLREGRVDLEEAYAKFDEGELFLVDAHISRYSDPKDRNHRPDRRRKLLLRRKQLNRLETKVEQSGYTLIPLELYFKGDNVKVRLGVCRGKKQFHKRQEEEQRQKAREMAREHARILDEREHKYDENT